jgi:hypothetical protein
MKTTGGGKSIADCQLPHVKCRHSKGHLAIGAGSSPLENLSGFIAMRDELFLRPGRTIMYMANGRFKKLTGPIQRAVARRKAPNLATDLRRARRVAELLDTKFKIAGIRFGIEGILGLVPVVGDTLGTLAGVYPIWIANRHKLGKDVQAKMAANLLVEWGGGLLPWVGDLFDVAFKANIRNYRLLERAVEGRSQM